MASERARRARRRRREARVWAKKDPVLHAAAAQPGATVERLGPQQFRVVHPTTVQELMDQKEQYHREKEAHHAAVEAKKTARGVCSTCGRSEKLTGNGTVGRHVNKATGSICDGVGQRPS